MPERLCMCCGQYSQFSVKVPSTKLAIRRENDTLKVSHVNNKGVATVQNVRGQNFSARAFGARLFLKPPVLSSVKALNQKT